MRYGAEPHQHLAAGERALITSQSRHVEAAKATNFEYLDPEAPRTKRIIDAALTVYVPWGPEQAPVFQRAKIADLAECIDQRAQLLEDALTN